MKLENTRMVNLAELGKEMMRRQRQRRVNAQK